MQLHHDPSEADHDSGQSPLSERMKELFPRGMPSPFVLKTVGLFVEDTNGNIADISQRVRHLANAVRTQRGSLEMKFPQTQVQPVKALIRNLFALADLVQGGNKANDAPSNGKEHAVSSEKKSEKKRSGDERLAENTQRTRTKNILAANVRVLWECYQECRDDDSRNQLIELYSPLVRLNAERMLKRLPKEVELDDLVSAGYFGLIDAIEAFDLTRGVKFETYCVPRIRGSMLDELRKMDWVPRLVRSKVTKLKSSTDELNNLLGRPPTIEELAKQMQMKVPEAERIVMEAGVVQIMSLDKKWYETDNFKDVREIDVLHDGKSHDPAEGMAHDDVMRALLRGLNKKERLIMIGYYYLGMTMKQIGESLDLSESRVSQMHSGICTRIAQSAEFEAHRGNETYKAITLEESM